MAFKAESHCLAIKNPERAPKKSLAVREQNAPPCFLNKKTINVYRSKKSAQKNTMTNAGRFLFLFSIGCHYCFRHEEVVCSNTSPELFDAVVRITAK